MLIFLDKKDFGWCKSQIFFIGDQNAGLENGFAGLSGHSANHEAQRSFSEDHGGSATTPSTGRLWLEVDYLIFIMRDFIAKYDTHVYLDP